MREDKQNSISAFVICFNEEANIRRCLSSLNWCSEIVIIDSGSTDRTLEICREFTDKIFHRSWTGYVDQKRFGLDKCSNTWALNIDADEEVSDELRDEILSIFKDPSSVREDGFYLSRVVFYLGRWWRQGGWYPEFRLRLCRRSATTWGGNDPHEKAVVSGQTRRLAGELFHYTYIDIADQVARLNKFSSSAAQTLLQKGERSSVFSILFRPFFRFVKFYLVKAGYRDGFAGLVLALLESYYVFLKYIKLWELQNPSK